MADDLFGAVFGAWFGYRLGRLFVRRPWVHSILAVPIIAVLGYLAHGAWRAENPTGAYWFGGAAAFITVGSVWLLVALSYGRILYRRDPQKYRSLARFYD